MPLYPIHPCPCGHTDDVFAHASEAGSLKCPDCGGPVEQDYAQKNVGNGNREFRGDRQESITEFYHSSEVNEARRELGASGSCVQPDGTVRFKDRAQQRQYLRDKAAMLQKFTATNEQKAAAKARDPERHKDVADTVRPHKVYAPTA